MRGGKESAPIEASFFLSFSPLLMAIQRERERRGNQEHASKSPSFAKPWGTKTQTNGRAVVDKTAGRKEGSKKRRARYSTLAFIVLSFFFFFFGLELVSLADKFVVDGVQCMRRGHRFA